MIRRIRREWRLGWTALALLTRLPVPRQPGFEPDWLPRSAVYFPLVGVVVGAAAAATFLLADLVLPTPLAPLLALAAGAAVTGALHEDGWADFFDALGAGGDRARMLEIMRDSRIGSYGALALIFLILGKLASLAALPPERVPAALVAAHALSRWTSVPLLWRLPYARPSGGMAEPLAARVSAGRLAAGTLIAAVITVAVLERQAAVPLAAAAVATAAGGWFCHRRLGGITGDCLGAVHQLVELTTLAALAAAVA